MRSLLTALAILICGHTANAHCMLSGWYLGLNSGYAVGHIKTSTQVKKNTYFFGQDAAAVESASNKKFHPSGYVGGVQTGYNLVMCSPLIWGLESDFGAFLLSKHHKITKTYPSDPQFTFSINQRIKTGWLFTLRPRIGFVCGQWLGYITGGLCLTDLKYSEHFTDQPGAFESARRSRTVLGWTFGGGVEYALSPCLSFFVSYLYTHFCHTSSVGRLNNGRVQGDFLFQSTLNHTARLRANVVRLGFNYKL